tara:strand:+ start:5363 stop:5509 length:147 start_codon:yes stop_codon:yes gene_type:complete
METIGMTLQILNHELAIPDNPRAIAIRFWRAFPLTSQKIGNRIEQWKP